MEKTITPSSRIQLSRLSFPYKGGIHFFNPDQIIRLEAESNYTCIHIQNHKPILMAKVLSDYESLLAPLGFIRTHRAHLINCRHVAKVNLKREIIMDDESIAGISRRKRKEVLRALKHYSNAA